MVHNSIIDNNGLKAYTLICVATLFFMTNVCCGQNLFLKGTIADKNNRIIKKAKVSLYTSKDSLVATTKTDRKGFYQFQTDIQDVFYIRVEKTKFSSKIVKDIKTSLSIITLDIFLEKDFDLGPVY